MLRFLTGTRFLLILAITGLAIVAAFFFVFGNIGLIRLLVEFFFAALGVAHHPVEMDRAQIIFDIVEFVHLFLVGTVLYITAIGLYQLFDQEIKFHNWLRIDSTEELKTSLIV